MLFRYILVLSLLPVAIAFQIRHTQLKLAHLIETSPENYAITTPTALLWRTLTINGNNMVGQFDDCKEATFEVSSMTPEMVTYLKEAREPLDKIAAQGIAPGQDVKYGSWLFSENEKSQVFSGHLITQNFRIVDGVHIVTHGPRDYSVAGAGLPDNMTRLFHTDWVVVFVWRDGTLTMKPEQCLNEQEQAIVQKFADLAKDPQEAEKPKKNSPPPTSGESSKPSNELETKPEPKPETKPAPKGGNEIQKDRKRREASLGHGSSNNRNSRVLGQSSINNSESDVIGKSNSLNSKSNIIGELNVNNVESKILGNSNKNNKLCILVGLSNSNNQKSLIYGSINANNEMSKIIGSNNSNNVDCKIVGSNNSNNRGCTLIGDNIQNRTC